MCSSSISCNYKAAKPRFLSLPEWVSCWNSQLSPPDFLIPFSSSIIALYILLFPVFTITLLTLSPATPLFCLIPCCILFVWVAKKQHALLGSWLEHECLLVGQCGWYCQCSLLDKKPVDVDSDWPVCWLVSSVALARQCLYMIKLLGQSTLWYFSASSESGNFHVD